MKIVGNTVGTTTPRPDLTQENPAKADFVKGKHIIDEIAAKAVEQHDASAGSHSDIRKLIESKQPVGDYLTEESDPTVPAWAKAPEKPSYSPEEVGAAPASHTADRGNPHGVTAEQVGARPDTWMPSAVDVGAVPASHLTNMANPHMVTAEQVGARPVTWTPTAAEVGARADSWMPTAEEVGARSATWMPTLAEIGAAPAITEKMTLEYASRHPAPNDVLNVMLNGDYTADNMQPGYIATENASVLVNSPITSGAFYAYREVEAYPVGHVLVRLKEMYPCSGRVWSNMYDKNYQKWMGWHCGTPVVAQVGVEQITNEIFDGRPVYTKLVSCGVCPSQSIKMVAHGASVRQMMRVHASLSNYGITAPYFNVDNYNSDKNYLDVTASATYVIIKCSTTAWAQNGYSLVAQIWYTKL